eukprot:CAMPEP_0175080504 /NCGR_PEP_ID=MMETSP0052_2-20121109/25548_1 /TAXON_ID=51329 ORGANISM="Polytomella parva, Strain SAG 63-3" /NCGR_SAMPLE_ID=MMETSP0052_2 /ASSEMBLY_ACC=CAM_ASM_000194 /LENGTH=1262 /DNA_ID=CAMNT_0016351219 /DNA_START=29 /DNA_END=3813 /DNA_ORIENTATION=+
MAGIEIIPPILEFQNVQKGIPISLVVKLKNHEARTKTVRLREPKTSFFSLSQPFYPSKIASGLDLQFEVIFHSDKIDPAKNFYQDKIVLQTEAGEFTLVLKASTPRSNVQIVGDLNFDILPTDSKATKHFQLVNYGSEPSFFKLDWDRNLPIEVKPAGGVLMGHGASNSTVDVTVEVQVREPAALGVDISVMFAPAPLDVLRNFISRRRRTLNAIRASTNGAPLNGGNVTERRSSAVSEGFFEGEGGGGGKEGTLLGTRRSLRSTTPDLASTSSVNTSTALGAHPGSHSVDALDDLNSPLDQISFPASLSEGVAYSDIRKISLSAVVVKQTIELLENVGKIVVTDLDFGSLYYGEGVSKQLVLFNNGPIDINYTISYGTMVEMRGKIEDDPAAAAAAAADSDDPYSDIIMAARQRQKARLTCDNPFSVTPVRGTVPPFGRGKFSVSCTPTQAPIQKGFSTTMPASNQAVRAYEYFAVVEFEGLAQKIKIPLRVRGMPGGVTASPSTLFFGEIMCHEWADLIVTLTNTNTLLTAKFAAAAAGQPGSLPYFEIQPGFGSMLVNGTTQLLVRYWPKSLGTHSGRLKVRVASEKGQHIQDLFIEVNAISIVNPSMTVGGTTTPMMMTTGGGGGGGERGGERGMMASSKKEGTMLVKGGGGGPRSAMMVGGIDKLPQDFERPKRFVDQDQSMQTMLLKAANTSSNKNRTYNSSSTASSSSPLAASSIIPTNSRHLKPSYEKPELVEIYPTQPSKDTYTREEAAALSQHRAKYTAATRLQREARRHQRRMGKIDEGDVNLGMNTRSGLTPPEPQWEQKVEPLWTMEAMREAAPKAQRGWSDRDLEGVSPFPDLPSDAERELCSKELTRDQLGRIVVGPMLIDFEKVSMGSPTTQYLVISNTLDQCIHVVLDLAPLEDFHTSKHSSQVIPAGSLAKFPLTLLSHEFKSIHERIDYTINASHVHSFSVIAEVVPVNLTLNADDLTFQFSLDNWDDFVDKVLVLDNPQRFPVEYSVTLTNPAFKLEHPSGVIRPQSSCELALRWEPDLNGLPVQEGYLVLTVVGGESPRRVLMRGELPESNVRAKEKEVNAGAVAVGAHQHATLQIRNHGTRDSAFRVLLLDPKGSSNSISISNSNALLSISPALGKISPEETMDLDVTFHCDQEGVMNLPIEIEIRGGKRFTVLLKAEGVVPQVEITQDEFDFGRVLLGSFMRLPLEIKNPAPVPVNLICDLTALPEFQLTLPKDAWSPEDYDQCPLRLMSATGSEMGLS